jgi:hypothetical protein
MKEMNESILLKREAISLKNVINVVKYFVVNNVESVKVDT